MQRLAGRLGAGGALGLEDGEPHGVARLRDLARPEPQPPVARLGPQPRQRVERAGERGLAAIRERLELGDALWWRRRGGRPPGGGGRVRARSRPGGGWGLGWGGGERVALGGRLGEAALQLGGLELERLDRSQGLGGDPGLGLLGRLGAAGPPLGEHRAVDDLAALGLAVGGRSRTRSR